MFTTLQAAYVQILRENVFLNWIIIPEFSVFSFQLFILLDVDAFKDHFYFTFYFK